MWARKMAWFRTAGWSALLMAVMGAGVLYAVPRQEPSESEVYRAEGVTEALVKIILAGPNPRCVEVYGVRELITEQDVISSEFAGNEYRVPTPSRFYFIDDHPDAKFAHPVRYLFVPVESGETRLVPEMWWPALNGVSFWDGAGRPMEGLVLVYRDRTGCRGHVRTTSRLLESRTSVFRVAYSWNESATATPSPVQVKKESRQEKDQEKLEKCTTAPRSAVPERVYGNCRKKPKKFAIVVDGGGEDADAIRDDAEKMAAHFESRGYQVTRLSIKGQYMRPTKENLRKAIEVLSHSVRCNDIVVISISAHGWNKHFTLYGRELIKKSAGSERIADVEFDAWLDRLKTCNLHVVLTSCGSGGMLAALTRDPGRTIATQVTAYETAYVGEFEPDFVEGFKDSWDWNSLPEADEPPYGNADGKVSFAEASRYAQTSVRTPICLAVTNKCHCCGGKKVARTPREGLRLARDRVQLVEDRTGGPVRRSARRIRKDLEEAEKRLRRGQRSAAIARMEQARRALVRLRPKLSDAYAGLVEEALVFLYAAMREVGAFQVTREQKDGLLNLNYRTPAGDIRVAFPDDMRPGDTISGTVIPAPRGRTAEEREQNRNLLAGYVVEVEEQEAVEGAFITALGSALLSVFIRDPFGNVIEEVQIPSPAVEPGLPPTEQPESETQPEEPETPEAPEETPEQQPEPPPQSPEQPEPEPREEPRRPPESGPETPREQVRPPEEQPEEVGVPPEEEEKEKGALLCDPELRYGQAGRPSTFRGPLDGNFETTQVRIGPVHPKLLAESPRKVVFENPFDVLGAHPLMVQEREQQVECPYRVLALQLEAEKLHLTSGETTTLWIRVLGLENLTDSERESLPWIYLENRSPDVITIDGGDQQWIPLEPEKVGPRGTLVIRRTIRGVRAGSYGISARLVRAPGGP